MDTGYNEFLKGRLAEFEKSLDAVILGLVMKRDNDSERHIGMKAMIIELSSKLDLLLAEFIKGSTATMTGGNDD